MYFIWDTNEIASSFCREIKAVKKRIEAEKGTAFYYDKFLQFLRAKPTLKQEDLKNNFDSDDDNGGFCYFSFDGLSESFNKHNARNERRTTISQ